MTKRDFRARRTAAPSYPVRPAGGARNLVVTLAAAAALSGGLTGCGGQAPAPEIYDAGKVENVGGGADYPDAGEPDAGSPDAGPVDQTVGGGAPQPDTDAGTP